MIYSRAAFLSDEDVKDFKTLDEEGWLMNNFRIVVNEGDWLAKTLRLPYFLGMKKGNLDPTNYGSLLVLDAYYCYNSVITIQTVKSRMHDNEKKYAIVLDDMDRLVDKYVDFAKTYLTDWHLASESTTSEGQIEYFDMEDTHVVPTDNVESYAYFERSQAKTQEPMLGLITLFTCYEFWPLLFGSFGTDIPASNVYRKWILGNQGGNSAKVIDAMVERWTDAGNILSDEMVKNIFNDCLNYEYNMFKEM